MLPRGLITAVLALQIVSARGAAFNFLPAMAFTVVMVTNAFVVIAAFRLKPAKQMEGEDGPPMELVEPLNAQSAAAGASGAMSMTADAGSAGVAVRMGSAKEPLRGER